MNELAINGGVPVRNEKIFYGHQWIDENDIKAVDSVLKNDYLTRGPKGEEFEKKLANYVNSKYAVAVSNGTAALHCACIAAGIGDGDEVITTPMTFAASANCILYCGAKPVFADIDPETYNIDPNSVEKLINSKTKAIIAVDFTGQAVKIDELRKICNRHNLIFIEDAAHSIGTKYNGKPVGSLADMTCFSFHPVKTITGGEGGAITTNNEELYNKLFLAHTHGIIRDCKNNEPWHCDQLSLGYNYRLTDFQAALLSSQLGKIDKFIKRRKEIVEKYNKAFNDIPELILQKEIKESDTCRHIYILQLNLDKLNCTRREFFEAMSAENIQCQVHYVPIYKFSFYQKLGYKNGICPIAEKLYERIITIPLYPMMTDKDVDDVIKAVKKCIDYYRK